MRLLADAHAGKFIFLIFKCQVAVALFCPSNASGASGVIKTQKCTVEINSITNRKKYYYWKSCLALPNEIEIFLPEYCMSDVVHL